MDPRQTFQHKTESSGSDIEAAWLEPDTIRVRNPQIVIVEIDVGDKVLAASLIRLKPVAKTAERGNWHVIF